MTPTAKQKKTWRRRVSRAKHTQNSVRALTYFRPGDVEILVYDRGPGDHPARHIRAPWQRTGWLYAGGPR